MLPCKCEAKLFIITENAHDQRDRLMHQFIITQFNFNMCTRMPSCSATCNIHKPPLLNMNSVQLNLKTLLSTTKFSFDFLIILFGKVSCYLPIRIYFLGFLGILHCSKASYCHISNASSHFLTSFRTSLLLQHSQLENSQLAFTIFFSSDHCPIHFTF